MSDRKIPKRIFTKGGPKIFSQISPNGINTKFHNTRIILIEGMEIGPPEHKEIGNLIQFVRAQETDSDALCRTKKLKVVNKKATTLSEVGLSDEALEALYMMLKVRFEGVPTEWKPRKVTDPFTDEALRAFIDTWPPAMTDPHLAKWLNDMELPWEQYQMAIDYYKKIGPYGTDTTEPQPKS